MSFENKHERKLKRKSKLEKEFKSRKFKLYGDVSQKHPYKRKDKYEFIDEVELRH